MISTYVNKEESADAQTWKGDTVANLLQEWSSRSEGGRCDIASTVVVHHNTDYNVGDTHDRLAEQK